jgi:hypothetical protein
LGAAQAARRALHGVCSSTCDIGKRQQPRTGPACLQNVNALVVGTTHRYKSKYITTVMYKPSSRARRRASDGGMQPEHHMQQQPQQQQQQPM